MAVLSVAMASCSKDDDDANNAKQSVTITIENVSSVRGHYLLQDWWMGLSNDWLKGGYSFDLYLAQGSKMWFVGTKHSNENSLTDLNSNLTVNVPINSEVDTDQSYNVIAVDANCKAKFEGGAIVCNANLERNNDMRIHAWYVADVGRGYASIAQPRYITASEILYIRNNTSKAINVKHKGFDAKEKWYYGTANVKIVNSGSIKAVVDGKSIGQEVESPTLKIDANKEDYILTRFAPTGKKMTDASLVLEIDGKEVRTPPASSQVSIQNGIPYKLIVKWDGTKLEWDFDE